MTLEERIASLSPERQQRIEEIFKDLELGWKTRFELDDKTYEAFLKIIDF